MKKISFNEAASKNVMTASQMKQIKGGSGTCAFYSPMADGNFLRGCDVSKAEALSVVSVSGGRWCCDSCYKVNWYM